MLPSLLPALRAIVPSTHAAFFYDATGNMTNMYAERMLPPEAMARYYERHHYRADASAFAKSYQRLVAASDPVSYRSISGAERQSDYFREVLSALDVGHIVMALSARRPTVEPIRAD